MRLLPYLCIVIATSVLVVPARARAAPPVAPSPRASSVSGSLMGDIGLMSVLPLGIEAQPAAGIGATFGYQPAAFWALAASFDAADGNDTWLAASFAPRVYLPGTGLFAVGGLGYAKAKVQPVDETQDKPSGSGLNSFAELGFVGAEDARGGLFVSVRLDVPMFQLDYEKPQPNDYPPTVTAHRYGTFLSLRLGYAF